MEFGDLRIFRNFLAAQSRQKGGGSPRPPALGAQSLTRWTTREVPRRFSFGVEYLINF